MMIARALRMLVGLGCLSLAEAIPETQCSVQTQESSGSLGCGMAETEKQAKSPLGVALLQTKQVQGTASMIKEEVVAKHEPKPKPKPEPEDQLRWEEYAKEHAKAEAKYLADLEKLEFSIGDFVMTLEPLVGVGADGKNVDVPMATIAKVEEVEGKKGSSHPYTLRVGRTRVKISQVSDKSLQIRAWALKTLAVGDMVELKDNLTAAGKEVGAGTVCQVLKIDPVRGFPYELGVKKETGEIGVRLRTTVKEIQKIEG